MTSFWTVLILLVVRIFGKITFEKANMKLGADYGQAHMAVESGPNGPVLNADANITRRLIDKINVKMTIFQMQRKRKRLLMTLPTFNYCDLYGGLVQFDIIKALFEQLQKFGNATRPCPLEVGNYYMKNVQIDDKDFAVVMAAFPAAKYVVNVEIIDAYRQKSVVFANADMSVSVTKK